MNTLRKNVLIALAALSMGAAAIGVQAQAPTAAPVQAKGQAEANHGRHAHAMTQEQRAAKQAERHAKRAERMAKRQAKLHDLLKLSPAQEPAWTAFAASARPQAERVRGEREAGAKLSAPARMEKRIAMQKQSIVAMESRLAALNTFYAQLTPEQKKLFDEHAQRRGGHHGHRGHDMRHG
jgi:Spy/CpxP family protein refolding chaperone